MTRGSSPDPPDAHESVRAWVAAPASCCARGGRPSGPVVPAGFDMPSSRDGAGEGALAPMPSRGSVRLGSADSLATFSANEASPGSSRARSSVLRETRTCSSVRRERGDPRQSPRGRAQWPREGAETANYHVPKVLTTAPRTARARPRRFLSQFGAADAGPLTRRSWVHQIRPDPPANASGRSIRIEEDGKIFYLR